MHHTLFWLLCQEQVDVDSITCVYQQAQPAGRHTGFIPVGWDQQVRMVQPVDADVFGMGKINRLWRKKFGAGNGVGVFPLRHIPGNNILHTDRQRNVRAFLPAQDVIQDIYRKFVLVFRNQHLVAALFQIVRCCAGRYLQGGYGVGFLITAAPSHRLVLKDNEKTAGGRFTGADAPHQFQIILLKHPAVGIGFLFHLPADNIRMPVDVGALG